MSERGDATRAKLIAAATDVVGQVGYAHATTKAIAGAAGVSEGTIYRHFPDKASLFYAAVLDRNTAIVEELTNLPARAGTGTVAGNLSHTLHRLAELRADILPLEIAMMTDPELASGRGRGPITTRTPDDRPPAITEYLAREQALGRVRAEVPCDEVEMILLAMVYGIAMTPALPGLPTSNELLNTAVHTFVTGLSTPGTSDAGPPARRVRGV